MPMTTLAPVYLFAPVEKGNCGFRTLLAQNLGDRFLESRLDRALDVNVLDAIERRDFLHSIDRKMRGVENPDDGREEARLRLPARSCRAPSSRSIRPSPAQL